MSWSQCGHRHGYHSFWPRASEAFRFFFARKLLFCDLHCLLLVLSQRLGGERVAVAVAVAATAVGTVTFGCLGGLLRHESRRTGVVERTLASCVDRWGGGAPSVGRLRFRGLRPESHGWSRADGEVLSLPRVLGVGLVVRRWSAWALRVGGRGGVPFGGGLRFRGRRP